MSEEMASDHAIIPVSSPCTRRHYAMLWFPVCWGIHCCCSHQGPMKQYGNKKWQNRSQKKIRLSSSYPRHIQLQSNSGTKCNKQHFQKFSAPHAMAALGRPTMRGHKARWLVSSNQCANSFSVQTKGLRSWAFFLNPQHPMTLIL